MKNLFGVFALLLLSFAFVGCDDDSDNDPENNAIQLSFEKLEDLGSDYVYEGWFITGDGPETAGRFSVDANGDPTTSSFSFPDALIETATAYVLTIEPANETGDALTEPSAVHILAGDFTGDTANLSTNDSKAIGTSFANSAGTYILATPTTSTMDDELSGVWFLDPTAGPGPGLELATLPTGWAYEGWAVINGTPYSTGTFTSVSGADDAAPFSGADSGPPFPGEDFVMGNANFPTNLQGSTIVISVEPVPDNSPAPFLIKPLVSMVADNASDHTPLSLGQNLGSLPSGIVSR